MFAVIVNNFKSVQSISMLELLNSIRGGMTLNVLSASRFFSSWEPVSVPNLTNPDVSASATHDCT